MPRAPMRIGRAARHAIGNARAEPPLDVGGRGPGRPLFLAADLGDAVPGQRLFADGHAVADRLAVRQHEVEVARSRNRPRSSPALPCGGRSRCGADRPSECSPARRAHWRAACGRAASGSRRTPVPASPACSRRAIAPSKVSAIPRPAMSLPLHTVRRIPRRFDSLDHSISGRKRDTSSPNAAPAQLPWKLLQECRSSGRGLWKYCDFAPAPGRHRPGGVLAVAGVNAALTAFVYQMLKHDRAGNRSAPNAAI